MTKKEFYETLAGGLFVALLPYIIYKVLIFIML